MAKQQEENRLPELKAAIRNKTPGQLYVFHGEERFLLQHYLNQLRKVVVDELTESFNYHRFTNETFDLQSFADAVENLPMMAERTMVQLDEVDIFAQSEDFRSKMLEIISDIPDYCTVVFTYETVEFKPDKRQKKLWEAISAGEIVEFQKQGQRDLVTWITRHFAARGKRISPELCVYLIDLTDGTMTSISSEIAKIASFSGAETICRSDIDAVTEPALDAAVFRMTDMLGAGDYTGAFVTLQKLLKMQQEPIMILGAVGNHLRRLAVARTLLDNGGNSAELARLCSIQEYPARKAMEAARRFSAAFFGKAAELVMETDYQMKTSFDTQQRLLELLILALAREAKNG